MKTPKKKRKLIITLTIAMIMLCATATIVYAATVGTGTRSGKNYFAYSAPHEYTVVTPWGITINDIEIVDATTKTSAGYYANSLEDLKQRSCYAVGGLVNENIKDTFDWLPNTSITTNCRIVYMKLFMIEKGAKTRGDSITFGTDNPKSAVNIFEFASDGTLLVDGGWMNALDSYAIQNNNTHYILAYFKEEDGNYNDGSSINKDLPITSIWETGKNETYLVFHPYEITLNANGGSGGSAKVYERYRAAVYLDYAGKKVMTSSQNKITIPTRAGYTFTGYYSEASGGTQYINANGYITSNFTKESFKKNTTLYAHWTPNTYPVKLDDNGGSGGSGSVTATYDSVLPSENIKVPKREYTVTYNGNGGTPSKANDKAAYTFNGYYTATSGGTQYVSNAGKGIKSYQLTSGTTLYAQWSSKSVTLPTASRNGYTFAGWYTSATGGTKINTSTYTPTGNVTLYAHWTPNTYPVTLNDNGGSGGSGKVTATYDKVLPNVTIPKREYTITYNGNGGTPSKSSDKAAYTFNGYYTATSGGTQYISKAGAGTKTYTLTSGTTLYAQWTSKSVTLPTATRDGYTFIGWYTAPTGGTKIEGATYTPSANTTLYAQWVAKDFDITFDDGNDDPDDDPNNEDVTFDEELPNVPIPKREYTVTFDGNGGTSSKDKDMAAYIFEGYFSADGVQYYSNTGVGLRKYDLTHGTTLYAHWTEQSITLATAEREGYSFAGWYTKPTGGTKIEGTTYTPSANVTLYAHWTADKYDVFLDENYDKPDDDPDNDPDNNPDDKPDDEPDKIEVTYDEDLPNVPIPKREYTVTFDGNGGTSSKNKDVAAYLFEGYFSADGVQYYSNAGVGLRKYDLTHGTTLYAHWTEQSVTLATAEREGYSFVGWYTEPNGGEKITGSKYTPTSNVTLYAHWTKNEYDVIVIDVLNSPAGSELGRTVVSGTYGELIEGSVLGDSTERSEYYEGYCYSYCTSTKVTTGTNTVYRIFVLAHFKITFVDWDDTVLSERTYIYGATVNLPDTPSRPDEGSTRYTFLEWSPEVEICKKDMVYKAVYTDEVITYTVHFEPNGGKVGEVPSQTYVMHQEETLPKNEFIYVSYNFVGWAFDPEATTPDFTDEQKVTNVTTEPYGEVTLYAIWEKKDKYVIDVQVFYISTPDYTLKKTEEEIDAMTGYSDETKALMKYMLNDDEFSYKNAVVFTPKQIAQYKADLRVLPYMDCVRNINSYGTPYEEWINGR